MLTQRSSLFRGPDQLTSCTVTQRLAAGLTRLCLVIVDWSSNSSMQRSVGWFQRRKSEFIMSKLNLLYDEDSPHEGPPSKRQKTAGTKSDNFENKLTLPIALELGEESRDLELKLLTECLTSCKCDIAQPAKCQCRCCFYSKYGHVVFVPHDSQQDGEEGPGEKCADCVSVERTVRGQYAIEISDHLPLSPEVRHDLACHFRVIREILSKMFTTKIAEMRKKMTRVKIESMPILKEETSMLQKEIRAISGQMGDLEREIESTFTTVMRTGENISGAVEGSSILLKDNNPTLVHLPKGDIPGTDLLEEEINRLKTENERLETKIQRFEEEKDVRIFGTQSVPIKFITSKRKSDS
ncbi:uncharacterized protein Bfra_007101 [Botrytis fragariae]|uniref:Uncharacterized protein n=1 Tax=Botrytis fragariae TaxID=1964551 RepID=A0A8H6AIG4_9HELO|nr:uncharacterized protein Bfra_007101 [Botrytis fragariae]KAF5867906.1 hypothetical protein Bfra_007101 [Botrytis fragariae]